MKTIRFFSLFFCIILLMSGCSRFNSPGKFATDQNAQKMDELRKQQNKDIGNEHKIDVTAEKYLGGGFKIERSKILNLPDFFNKQIVVVKNSALDINSALAEVQVHVPCDIDVTPYHKPLGGDKIILNYQGTVKGLLDKITSYYSLFWEFENSQISIVRLKTENYKIFANVGKVNSSIEMNNSSSSKAGNGTGGSTSEGKGVQRSRIVSDVDIWKDVEADLKSILSKEGTVSVNRSAGFVSVSDSPWIHKIVKKYMDKLNDELSRQVAIIVKVYNLDINDTSSNGLNADAIFTNLKDEYSLSLKTLANSAATALSSGIFSGAILNTATGSLGQFSGSQFVLEALRSYGKVSLVTTASGISLNNQDLPIQNITNTGYLAETALSSNNYNTTTSMIPGNLTTGFSMIVTPHILNNNKIVLQYSVSLSNLDKMNVYKSGESTIQTPDYSSRSFTQRVALESGSTLLLAGFETDSNTDKETYQLWGLDNNGARRRSMIVISITVNSIEGTKS